MNNTTINGKINPTFQKTNNTIVNNRQNQRTNDNKKLILGTAVGLSLITLSTLGGIYYFTKRGINKNLKNQLFENINTDFKAPKFTETKTTQPQEHVETIQTLNNRHWNAVTSMYKDETVNWDTSTTKKKFVKETKNITTTKNKRTKDNWREQRNKEIIPGIIRRVSKEIKEYLKLSGVDKKNNKVNPSRLDEILTNAVGKENVTEKPYLVDGQHGLGRKKEYKSPNGRIYVLEAHDSPKGIVTRLYMNCPDKHLRAYLHADGSFRLNSYMSEEAHFATTAKGIRWMEESTFLNNKTSQ